MEEEEQIHITFALQEVVISFPQGVHISVTGDINIPDRSQK
jgi:hypothetical protein